MTSKSHLKRLLPYFACSIIFSLLFLFISYLLHWIPFGSNTLLTIDLGQQYIDFFSYYRDTLLHHPEQFLYSFQKGIGGEMVGLWTYYLLSPFNLVLLYFKQNQFAFAMSVLTYTKLLAMTWSFLYFSRQKYRLDTPFAIAFSLSYTFMSYTVTYWLNIMWLDGLILLPLIALALQKLITMNRRNAYILLLALTFISNYYIGFMIAIFLAFYAIYLIIEQNELTFKKAIHDYTRFIIASIVGTLISGIILYPAITSLLASKVNGTSIAITSAIRYLPKQILSKLFIGSFVFEEIKKGSPHLYAGTLVVLLVILYFINRHIRWQEKLVALFILSVFLLSFMYELLSKIWHGGQDPVWYPFRFSFLTTFFSIELAMNAFNKLRYKLSLPATFIMMSSFSVFCIYYLVRIKFYPYLSQQMILLTLFLGIIWIILLQFKLKQHRLLSVIALLFVTLDVSINSYSILKQLNYVPFERYQNYTTVMTGTIQAITDNDSDFYRIQKNAARTKNEPLFAHYNGLDNFSSTLESTTAQLFGYLGLPDTQASVLYGNGTLFLDDFFSVKYLLEPKRLDDEKYYHLKPISRAFDIARNNKQADNQYFTIYKNPDRFGLMIEVSPDIALPTTQFEQNKPIENQELLLRLIDFNGNNKPYYTEQALSEPILQDIELTKIETGDFYHFNSLIKDVLQFDKGSLTYSFKTDTDNPYYLSLPSQINDKKVRMELNGEEFVFASPFRQRQLVSIADNQALTNHQLAVILQTAKLQMNQLKLYEFDLPRYETMMQKKAAHRFEVTSFNHQQLTGNITTELENSYLLMTIPYDKNWSIQIDNQKVKPIPVLNDTLMAIPVSKGSHQITMHYFPKSIYYGTMLSMFGIVGFIILNTRRLKVKTKN
ncbi:YfhO family protein [Aerococcaceae bacterium zg-ZJ1578]|uniref:YfhO family protein n=1 Tax=Aerococcaceae bacterium zg-252 TaxID=2796928 RepID=UPI001A208248|nr:YfhO family protein [Aerococcaceae bacterium zg-1578]